MGLSLILVYLYSWLLFCVPGAPAGAWAYGAASAVCAILAVASWRDAVRLFRSFPIPRTLAAFGFLVAWTLTALAIIRVYSGAGWIGDWLEHFQRTLYFLHHFPLATPIHGDYQLPARPPMMNVIAAFFLGQTHDHFENFQVVFAFLNLLPFLACCLLLPRLAVLPRRARVVPLVLVFALNPAFMQGATYTWTKAFAAFYVLIAVHFYLAGWQRQDRARMLAAFLALAASMLVHYSAGPYILFFTLHFLLVVWRRREEKWREASLIAVSCGLLLATWFGWSLHALGAHATFASNTSITSSQQYQGSNLVKIAGNLIDTVVPVELRDPSQLDIFNQPNTLGKIRDWFFISYQVNLLLLMGICGGLVALWLYLRAMRGKLRKNPALRNFWLVLVPFCVVLGVATTGERDVFGSAHLTLLPIAFLGLTLVAGAFKVHRRVAVLVLCGCLVDFAAGVVLQLHVESLENLTGRTVFTGLQFHGGGAAIGPSGPESLNVKAWRNWEEKHQVSLVRQWMAALEERGRRDPGFAARARSVTATLTAWLAQDQAWWHGWYSNHGGSVTFLGDHVGGESGTGTLAAEVLLIVLMLGLMAAAVRELPNAATAPAAAPRQIPAARAPVKKRARRVSK